MKYSKSENKLESMAQGIIRSEPGGQLVELRLGFFLELGVDYSGESTIALICYSTSCGMGILSKRGLCMKKDR